MKKTLYLLILSVLNIVSLKAAPQLIHKLAQFGPRDYIRDLIESGTNPDLPDSEGRSPLIFAASAGNIKNFLTLLASGAQLLKQDKQHRNAITQAIQAGQKRKIKLALAAIYLLSLDKAQADNQKPEVVTAEPEEELEKAKTEKTNSDTEPEKEF